MRLGEDQKSYLTKQEFLTRFWAAYTYDETQFDEEEENKQQGAKDNDENEAFSVPMVNESISHNVLQANRKI